MSFAQWKKPLFSFLLVGISIFLTSVSAGSLKFNPSSGTVYEGCYMPFSIEMDTEGSQTTAVDAKFFLSGNFDYHRGYHSVNSLSGVMDVTTTNTGVATTGTFNGSEYLYINAYNNFSSATGSNGYINLVNTMYLKPNLDSGTGTLPFYFISGRNGDDSNITSGINNNTQYIDALTTATTGVYTFSSGQTCPWNPHILEAEYRQYTYIETSTGVQQVRTSVMAGPDYTTSQPTDWNIWTNPNLHGDVTGVNLIMTGGMDGYAEKIKISWVAMQDDANIDLVDNTGWTYSREFFITGNIYTGFAGVVNQLDNEGKTYSTGGTNYIHDFNLDVFWIDTVKPDDARFFTGYLSETGFGYQTFTLNNSGSSGVSDAASGWHASWTTKDDEFKIYKFSGYNTDTQWLNDNVNPTYSSTIYMDYLNDSGYVQSGNLNSFKTGHTLTFYSPWSGTVYFQDRAGNTGSYFIDADTVETALIYTINAPSDIYKIAIYSGINSGDILSQNLKWTGWVKIDTGNTYEITGSNLGNFTGLVLMESVKSLVKQITDVTFNQGGATINGGAFTMGKLFGTTTTSGSLHANYDSIKNGIIFADDLAAQVTAIGNWTDYQANIGDMSVYSGGFFIDKNVSGTSLLEYATTYQTYKHDLKTYHPYDLDKDGEIDRSDYTNTQAPNYLNTSNVGQDPIMPF